MYIDERVSLRNDLPDGLRHDFKILQEYYDNNDWFMSDTVFEELEVSVKAHYLAGKTNMDDLNSIFRKYGIA